jgi:Mg-chelatase subunit ChlI
VANIIVRARETLQDVNILKDQVLYMSVEVTRANCDGPHGEIFATQVAKTCAAIDGRTQVVAQALITAVRLALEPRSNSKTTLGYGIKS